MYKNVVLSLLLVIGSLAVFAQTNWILPKVAETKFKAVTYNITKYGAVPDGHQLNTRFIQNAIDDCSKKGGGTVLLPSGLWLTGPIVLKSNVNLNLAVGATLLFTKDKTQYPLVKANWEGYEQMRNQSPISAEGATNIAITGKGIIDGNGDGWRMVKKINLLSRNGRSW
ncbi:glycoside hydrolase family 28 protein [Niabella sp. CJ426]|uniref:glycoside hydrolase family 28 protein n=1 Tax=Niabella sp. CJ426 TaxID=3393740 RepID=UPI003D0071AA